MKIFGVIIYLLFVLSWAVTGLDLPENDDSVNNYIKEAINNFKGRMKGGVPELNIPVLDPLLVNHFEFNHVEEYTEIAFAAQNISLTGLSELELSEVDANIQKLELKLQMMVPNATIYSNNYNLSGIIIGIFPISGRGKMRAEIHGLDLKSSGRFDISADGYLELGSLKLDASFDKTFLKLDELVGGGELGELANTIFSAFGPAMFDKFKPFVLPELEKAIVAQINNEIKKLKPKITNTGNLPI